MRDQALETLFLAFREHPPILETAEEILFIRAEYHEELNQLRSKNLVCLQSDRPKVNGLLLKEFKVREQYDQTADLVLMLGTKDKEENLFNMAQGISCLREGGFLVCSMPNNLGAGSCEKRLKETTGNISSYSKHKCRVFWTQKGSDLNNQIIADWKKLGSAIQIDGTPFQVPPGIFSRHRIDPGSLLLSEYLPPSLKGIGADFGAGYGFLSHHVLSGNNRVKELHLYESEKLALDAAEKAFNSIPGDSRIFFHWHDLTSEPTIKNLDWIIMNPPFHNGKDSDAALGQRFIAAAAAALKPHGNLYMVANQHLPYKKMLGSLFRSTACRATKSGYAVIFAKK